MDRALAAPIGAATSSAAVERWGQVLALGEAPVGDRLVLGVGGRHLLLPDRFRPVLEHLVRDDPPVEREATIVSLRRVVALQDAPALADLLLRLRLEDTRLEIAWRNWWRGFVNIPLWRPSAALVDAARGRVLTPGWMSAWAIALLLAVLSLNAGPLPAVRGLAGWEWAAFWAMVTVTTFVHELGHLFVAAHYGVRARSVGIGLLYLQPAGYTDVSNAWLVRRRARIAISLGGLLFQSVPLLACYAAWRVTGWPLLGWYCLISLGWMAFNFLPFIRLDGYWILCFALDEFNLRQRAFAQCLHTLMPHRVPAMWSGTDAALAVLFGALSALFTAGLYVSGVAWVQSIAPAPAAPFVPFVAWGAAVATVGFAALRGRLRARRETAR